MWVELSRHARRVGRNLHDVRWHRGWYRFGDLDSWLLLRAKGVGHHDHGTTQHVFPHGVVRLLFDHPRHAWAQHDIETWPME